uniref:GYF domain-containing protein n=1 Tax=Kalanchoe fedtschenkoi TaxID=63787 RepID=A0A7N0UBU7_KALFE
MASININPFGDWFQKPRHPIAPINLVSFLQSKFLVPHKTLNFASSSISTTATTGNGGSGSESVPPSTTEDEKKEPSVYQALIDQYFWECENLPDYRHTPEVERLMKEDPLFERRENATEEEKRENERWWNEFRESPFVQFMKRAEEIKDMINEDELKENDTPYQREDKKRWQSIPHVRGLDGRPMPRRTIKTKQDSDDRFWDFARQFFLGLWGFRQRPYPPGRPIDVAQAIGYKNLERRYYDFIMRSGGFYYKDRLGRTRGPLELITLKTAWGGGIIDRDTFIWGEDMDEWAPIHMVYGLEPAIATWEVKLGAAATEFLHKLQKGIPPWVPLKGREKKTLKQLQEEAMENKRRDQAVLDANNGIWPGVRIPSYALFLWASGSDLTPTLEADHMPNKFIPKDLRKKLAKVIPGLRPWEVLSVEQAMDQITYNGEWYREPLGSHTTGPPYIEQWNKDVRRLIEIFESVAPRAYQKLVETLPGIETVMEEARKESLARFAKRREEKLAAKEAAKEEAMLRYLGIQPKDAEEDGKK